MATEHTRERDPLAPLREGDFQRIPGIGPGIAQRLHAAGILTFRQLASMTPDEINALLNGLVGMTSERIAHQEWPCKAGQFANAIAEADPPSELEDPRKRQHYASFMVELLQDENHVVRRTRVVHVQADTKDSWAGWDAGRLGSWIACQASVADAPAPSIPANQEPPPKPAEPPAMESQAIDPPAIYPPAMEKEQPARGAALKLGRYGLFCPGGGVSMQFLTAGQPFEIRLPLEVNTRSLWKDPLHYHAVIQAHPVGGKRFQVADTGGALEEGGAALVIPVEGLPAGVYHLETAVLVYPEGAAQPEKEGRKAFSEGGLIYVYAQDY